MCEKLRTENRQAYSAYTVGAVKQEKEIFGYYKSCGEGFQWQSEGGLFKLL